jgi:hypothetical protein
MSNPEKRGYDLGLRGTEDQSEIEAERQTFDELVDRGMTGEELSDFWLGYFHGRADRRRIEEEKP